MLISLIASIFCIIGVYAVTPCSTKLVSANMEAYGLGAPKCGLVAKRGNWFVARGAAFGGAASSAGIENDSPK